MAAVASVVAVEKIDMADYPELNYNAYLSFL